jgi:DNA-binding NarL/FixJ family response regulator
MHSPGETESFSFDDAADTVTLTAGLPSRLRLLCVCPVEPSWVSLSLILDAERCHQPQFRWVSTSSEALALLRNESFDCVLVSDRLHSASLDAPTESQFNVLSLVRAIRASGCDDPIVLITTHVDEDRWARLCECECEILITSNLWESIAIIPVIKRAFTRVGLLRDNHRMEIADHRRLVRDRDEADSLLTQQRQIIRELEALAQGAVQMNEPEQATSSSQNSPNDQLSRTPFPLPDEINDYYQELLRTYVIMGSGSLGNEITKLAELISAAGLSPRETLQLHLERLETLVRGLGSRSTRHVMARADLLALELMMHLGECYQRQITG